MVNVVKRLGEEVLKKRDKKVNNVLYALVFELVLIPILAYVSFFIYTKLTLIDFIGNSHMATAIVLIFLTVINLVLIYYIAYAMNHIFKFTLEYQIVVGLIVIFIAIWFKVYYHALVTPSCDLSSPTECLSAMTNDQAFTTVLILLVAYNLVYVPVHIITKKNGKSVKITIGDEQNKKK